MVDPNNNNAETVRDVLLKKNPPEQPPRLASLIESNSQPPEPHPVMSEVIDGQLILNTVLKMDGAAGPSGLDAAAWKCILLPSKQHQLTYVNHRIQLGGGTLGGL